MSAWAEALIGFIGAHPHWAGVLVFLIAASEAVVVIGYVIPGTAILLTIGGIAGLGHLPLMQILVWAAAGAVAGDGFSYWLGHTYQNDLLRRWPFSRYPELMDRGKSFFRRHGGKSVFLGRFVPVLKPIVPVVAGILGMPPARFYVANVISAVIWSPAHILPGVLVGLSLGLLHGISARLVVVTLGALVVAALLVCGARVAVVRLAPVVDRLHRRAFTWIDSRPGSLVHRFAAPFDPDHPGTPSLMVTLFVLVVATLGFAGVMEDVITGDPLVRADRAISHLVQGLRNPWTDPVMVVVTTLGDAAVTVPVVAAVLGWLAVVRAWRLAGGMALALVLAGTTVILVKGLVHAPRPEAMYAGIDAYAFPSGHTAMAAVLYGLAAWLAASGLGPRGRALAYATSFGWVLAIAVSRVYLGAHWPSDVLGGLFLGTLVVAAVALLYRRVPRERLHALGLVTAVAVVFSIAGAWHLGRSYEDRVARYLPREKPVVISVTEWQGGRWQDLPAQRVDLAGEREESFSLQWLGTPAALEQRLVTAGWSRSSAWTVAAIAGFVKPDTPLDELPALPALHDGRKPVLLLVRGGPGPAERWALRAWASGFESSAAGQRLPLLVASVVRERESHPGRMLTLLRVEVPDRPLPPAFFEGLKGIRVQGRAGTGGVILAGENDPAGFQCGPPTYGE